MRIVLDTNVLVSGMLNPDGARGSILNAVFEGDVTALLDSRILFEYHDVLLRSKFRFPPEHVRSVLDFFEHEGEFITAGPTQETASDPGDVPFLEVAVAGNADYLVTGNERHYPRESFVVSPGVFADILRGRR